MKNLESAIKLIEKQKETKKIFYVEFIKKNGELRRMKCRFGVTSYLKGGELAFDPSEKGLIVVFDMEKQEYRMINKNTIKKVCAENETIEIA